MWNRHQQKTLLKAQLNRSKRPQVPTAAECLEQQFHHQYGRMAPWIMMVFYYAAYCIPVQETFCVNFIIIKYDNLENIYKKLSP
jgi:hypothetical protein